MKPESRHGFPPFLICLVAFRTYLDCVLQNPVSKSQVLFSFRIAQRGRENRHRSAEDFFMTLESRTELDYLFSVTYEELRRLAFTLKRTDGSITLNPTALVNEAWLKLAASPPFATTSPLHFKRIAARAMRQVLVEAARRRHAGKRGGDEGTSFVSFHEPLDAVSCEGELLGLDTALNELARVEPRQAEMVEGRFFGGLEIPEIAGLLGVSEATILRDWRAARAWLANELRR
jgi:RNA polymerase sigma factor (TIGR02999 family)